MLHLPGWRDGERRTRNRASARVHDRNRVASTLGHRLMQLHLVMRRLLEAGWPRPERIRRSREEEGGRGLDLLLQRRALRRARRQRSTVGRRGGVYRLKLLSKVSVWSSAKTGLRQARWWETYVILSQEVERTENLIVVELEALGCLEFLEVLEMGQVLRCLLGTPLGFVLAVCVLRRDSRTTAAAPVVSMTVCRSIWQVVWCVIVVASHFG